MEKFLKPPSNSLSHNLAGELANLYWKCMMINVGKFYKYWIAEALSDDAEVPDEILTKSSAFIMSCMFIRYANDHQYLQERLTTTQEGRFNLYLDVGFDTVGCANDHLDETPQAYYSSIYGRFYRYAANKEWDMQEMLTT